MVLKMGLLSNEMLTLTSRVALSSFNSLKRRSKLSSSDALDRFIIRETDCAESYRTVNSNDEDVFRESTAFGRS